MGNWIRLDAQYAETRGLGGAIPPRLISRRQGAHKGRPYKTNRTESDLNLLADVAVKAVYPASVRISGNSVLCPPAIVHRKLHIFNQMSDHEFHLVLIRQIVDEPIAFAVGTLAV